MTIIPELQKPDVKKLPLPERLKVHFNTLFSIPITREDEFIKYRHINLTSARNHDKHDIPSRIGEFNQRTDIDLDSEHGQTQTQPLILGRHRQTQK